MATLTLTKLSKHIDNQIIIDDVTIDIQHGEMIVVVGPSGCGKSTLLRMVAGLETITMGEVFIDNQCVNHLEPKERDIAMVFQNYALYPHMTVYENMAYGLRIRGHSKQAIAERVQKVATMLHLEKYLQRISSQLSGGQRQRVAMGRAIVRQPKIFLFDEPLSNLDASLRVSMRLQLRSLQRELATTSIYVTHDQVEAMTLADRLIVINQGKVEQIGTPLELYQFPHTLFAASFIGSPAMNFIHAKIDKNNNAVVLSNGTIFNLPLSTTSMQHSQEITIGIRPEHFIETHATDPRAFSLQIDEIESLGSDTLIYGHLDGATKRMTVRMPGYWHASHGMQVFLTVRPDYLHIFNRQTGVRL